MYCCHNKGHKLVTIPRMTGCKSYLKVVDKDMPSCCANYKHERPGRRPAHREQVATVRLHGEDR